jgi:RND superfamily putative drug exporter
MAAAVLIDATIVRGVLLPAGLALRGERIWPRGSGPTEVTSAPVTGGVAVR